MIYCEPTKVVILQHETPLLTGPLFSKLESCEKKIIVVQGGGDAAKTSTILQWLAVKCIQTDNIQATVVGMSIPNLKRGAIRLFKKYVSRDPQISPFLKGFNQSDKEQHFNNGSILSFVSFEDDEEKARGAENDYVFINEANLLSYNLFWQLQRKCRKAIILDYNPTFAFWAHAKLIKGGEKQFIGKTQQFIVDHRHNPFLTEEEHQAYEDISDPEMFKVYSRGETGQTKGAIFRFKKVTEVPTKKVVDEKGNITETELDFGFGMDVGYTTDKTTIVKVWMNGKDHYYKELLYKSNDEIQNEINENSLTDDLGNPQTVEGYIKKILVENGMTTSSMVWGDHDKNMSSKLRRIGVPYRMAKKGPNSVTASISSVKRFNGHYIDSPNLEKELETYIFETVVDILSGNEVTTGEPIDGVPDHLLAAIRYYEHSYAMRFAG